MITIQRTFEPIVDKLPNKIRFSILRHFPKQAPRRKFAEDWINRFRETLGFKRVGKIWTKFEIFSLDDLRKGYDLGYLEEVVKCYSSKRKKQYRMFTIHRVKQGVIVKSQIYRDEVQIEFFSNKVLTILVKLSEENQTK